MAGYFEKKEELSRALEKYYKEKTNIRLKYAAIISIIISITIMLTMAFGLVDKAYTTVFLLMRGCAGLFAIVFAVLITILVYRVNASYIKDKTNARSKHNN